MLSSLRSLGLGSRTTVVSGAREFSTSPVCEKLYAHIVRRKQKKVLPLTPGLPRRFLPKEVPEFPAYPYGKSSWFKQADSGLYGGSIIQFGNQISEFRNKSRRSWLPNISRHALWSETLNRNINIKTTARVLRTITKNGGIDRYLVKDKAARIKELGPTGWKLRYRVLKKLEAQEKTAPKVIETIESESGPVVSVFFKHASKSTGSEIKITVGKRKVLKELFSVLKNKNIVDSHHQFVKEYSSKPIEDVLSTLESHNYDFSKISA